MLSPAAPDRSGDEVRCGQDRANRTCDWQVPIDVQRLVMRVAPKHLYAAGAEVLILAVLLLTERRGKPFAGRTFWLYIGLYAISRFIIEYYRGDIQRGTVFGDMSTSQFVSLLLVPAALLMLWFLTRRPQPTAA